MTKASTICARSIIALVTVTICTQHAGAYETYSVAGDDTNCRACHGDFRDSSYISLTDGEDWGNLHDLHRSTMLDGDCNTCHTSPPFPVFLDTSDGGEGLEPISCVGCHGRNEDMGHDSISMGRGAGLRQHHYNTGTTVCALCHADADPANYTPVGENVMPPYYFEPDASHPNKPTDSCNPNGEEDYAGIAEGLDNDGDGDYDEAADADCAAPALMAAASVGEHAGMGDIAFAIGIDGLNEPRVQSDGELWLLLEFDGDVDAGSLTASFSPPLSVTATVSAGTAPQLAEIRFDGDVSTGRYTVTLGGSASGEFEICYTRGDVNCSGDATGLDLAAIQSPGNWNKSLADGADARADVNRDGQATGLDLAAVQAPTSWNQPVPPLTCGCP